MAQQRGLGRGLSSLIPPKQNTFSSKQAVAASIPDLRDANSTSIIDIPLHQISPNALQPRQAFDPKALDELAQSIATYGLLEPIVVTQVGAQYQIVAGERRFRAHKLLGKQTVQAIIRTASELERLELALIENIQREDLNPVEKANGYAKLVDDFGLTQVEAAKKMGIARSSLANTIRLLDLPDDIQVGLAEGRISEGHAKVLLGLPTPEEQLRLYRQMTSGQAMSVRDLNDTVASTSSKKTRRSIADIELQAVAQQLQSTLGTKVTVKGQSGGKRQIVIQTYSDDEFKTVIKKMTRRV